MPHEPPALWRGQRLTVPLAQVERGRGALWTQRPHRHQPIGVVSGKRVHRYPAAAHPGTEARIDAAVAGVLILAQYADRFSAETR